MSGFQASILLLTKYENVFIFQMSLTHFDDLINVPFSLMIKIVWWGFFKCCKVCVFFLTQRKVSLEFANSQLN